MASSRIDFRALNETLDSREISYRGKEGVCLVHKLCLCRWSYLPLCRIIADYRLAKRWQPKYITRIISIVAGCIRQWRELLSVQSEPSFSACKDLRSSSSFMDVIFTAIQDKLTLWTWLPLASLHLPAKNLCRDETKSMESINYFPWETATRFSDTQLNYKRVSRFH